MPGNRGLSGFGGLIRKGDRSWVFDFSSAIAVSCILKAELLGLFYGLESCWHCGVHRVVVSSDSLQVLQLVKDGCPVWHHFASIVGIVRRLIGLPWEVTIAHVPREGNVAADFIAKMGASSSSSLVVHELPPHGLQEFLVHDLSFSFL